MPSIKLYVEGGGDSNALRTNCRRGFRTFLEKAGLQGKMPRIIACGSRNDAFSSFCTALRQSRGDLPLLLVDSEAIVTPGDNPWTHLHRQDNWQRPEGASDDGAHLVVQCMEAWLIADPDALANYFGKGFNRNRLPRLNDLETVPKPDIYRSLKDSTRSTSAASYSKGRDSFELLARIDPQIVRSRCPYAERFIAFLLNLS
jgi:hypothetical protein